VPVAPRVAIVIPDTLDAAGQRDAARRLVAASEAALAQTRTRNAAVDARYAAARARADFELPPLAALAAAVALAVSAGFLVALVGELRRPRVADAREAERATRTRVLAVVRDQPSAPERTRRRADRLRPRFVNPANDGWRSLYLGLAATGAAVPLVTVSSEEAPLGAAVVANLAALAAEDGRGTLVVDADVARAAASRALGVATRPGLADVARGRVPLADTLVPLVLGRDAVADVLPAGAAGPAAAGPASSAAAAALRDDLAELAARYDFVVVAVASTERGPDPALRGALLGPDAIVCVHAGHTSLPALSREIARLRARGATVRGLVVWEGAAVV
jgi:Mrp family chromosome partitioning ATPase